MQKLKTENRLISHNTLKGDEHQIDYFKKMSAKNLEQFGSLAEQLICLRNDLDKSHFDIMKIQRQKSVSTENNIESTFDSKYNKQDMEILRPEQPPCPEPWVASIHTSKKQK